LSIHNRTQEVLELITGYYEVTSRDEERGYLSISFWLGKPMGNAEVSLEGLRCTARLGDKSRTLTPERLDVSGERVGKRHAVLGMRLPINALPKSWVGECEITIGNFRSFPFKGIPDISKSLKPESMRP